MFLVNKELYSKEVLYRVCYSFTDRFFVHLDANAGSWLIELKPKSGAVNTVACVDEGEFNNALLNEAFRESLSADTKVLKEMIVSRALYAADVRSSIVTLDACGNDSEFSFLDEEIDKYVEDPMGIAVPWEEKNKQNGH